MRTKIVATLGPASSNRETMKAMAENGVRIFRLNFSHSDAAHFAPVIETIRSIESELSISLTAMGDLCGPKIRIGEIPDSPVQVDQGEEVNLGLPELRGKGDKKLYIPLDMPALLEGLEPGMPVSLSDGMLQFEVTEVVEKDRLVIMRSHNQGILTSNKGIAFPGKSIALPAMTDKDRKDLHEGMDIGLDAVALSFVQTKKDIEDIKAEIAKHDRWIPVIAKIERRNAFENLESILALTDGAMVARGDLGLECSLAELPVIQKKMIRACRHHQKACIVATQMLLSMVKNPIPTRAETTDVANAIMDGADCVMLSEETAVGTYPVETVKYMSQIACEAEEYYLERIPAPYKPKDGKDIPKYLAYSASLLAHNAESKALVSHSQSGSTVRLVSSRRPYMPIYGLTPDESVMRYLNFFWGVRPVKADDTIGNHTLRVQDFVDKCGEFLRGENVVITSGQPTPGQPPEAAHVTNAIKLYYK